MTDKDLETQPPNPLRSTHASAGRVVTPAEILEVMTTLAILAAPVVKVFAEVNNDKNLHLLPELKKKHIELALGLLGSMASITPEQLNASIELESLGGRSS